MHRISYSGCLHSTVLFLIFLFNSAFVKYEVQCDEEVKTLSYDIALNELGITEINNNRGEVVKYLNSINLGAGYPYCMAGHYWTFDSACRTLNKLNPLSKTGSTSTQFNYLKNKGRKIKFNINKYDLVFWKKKDSWQGHVERVIETGQAGFIKTIGFNVRHNNNEGVFIKKRNIFHIINRMRFVGAIGFKDE